MTLNRLCPKCGRLLPSPGRGPCDDCRRSYEREKSRRRRAMSTATRTRDTAAWQHARNQARARDGGCIHRTEGGCAGTLSVHHIVPLEHGDTNELINLVTLCRRHHEDHERRFLSGVSHTQIAAEGEKHSGTRNSSAKNSEGPSIG